MVSSGALPDPSFLFAQALSGLTAAMFLFLIAAGLSLIFGVLRVLNFSHGSFYMLGAYLAYQVVQWAATTPGRFWWATLGARSEEHTSELPSPCKLVWRLLLGKK